MSVHVIGHRGARGRLPELSLAGFSFALDKAVHGIELDVSLTKDDHLVAYHDLTLNPDITRNPDGQWISDNETDVRSLTLDQLRQYDIGRINPKSNYWQQFPDQEARDGSRIPTLEEVVELRNQRNPVATLCIEIKHSPVDPRSISDLDTLTDVIVNKITNLNIVSNAIVQAFDWRVIHRIRERLPELELWHLTSQLDCYNTLDPCLGGAWTDGYLLEDFGWSVPEMVSAAGGTTWSCDVGNLSDDLIKKAHSLGLKVCAWTANDEQEFQRLCDASIDAIVTDYPDCLIDFLSKRETAFVEIC